MKREYLRIDNGRKTEKDSEVLKDFRMTVHEGEITSVICSRIRELECLQHILTGYDQLTDGRFYLHDSFCGPEKTASLLRQECALISEPPAYIHELTIADNFVSLGSHTWPVFNQSSHNLELLSTYLRDFDIDINPELPVERLNQRQLFQLFLLNLYYKSKKAVILNLNFCSLTENELDDVFPLLIRLKKKGMAFLLLSDRLLPPRFSADRLVVVQNGITVMELDQNEKAPILLTNDTISRKKYEETFEACSPDAPPLLTLTSVHTKNLDIRQLTLRKGEKAIIFAHTSEHKKELFQLLSGEIALPAGAIKLDGRAILSQDRRNRLSQGILCVENRLSPGFLSDKMSVFDNYVFLKGMQNHRIWRSFRHRAILRKDIEEVLGKGSSRKKISELSSYGQQLLKYMSCLLFHPKVLVCLDPFSSVNQKTEQMTIRMMNKMARMGTAVLILSGWYYKSNSSGATPYILSRTGKLLTPEEADIENADSYVPEISNTTGTVENESDEEAFWF